MRFAAAIVLLYGAAQAQPGKHRADLSGTPIINFHTHNPAVVGEKIPWDMVNAQIRMRVQAMDAANIRKEIILCLGFETIQSPNLSHRNSEEVAFSFRKAAPERFVVFTTVDFSRMNLPDFTAGAVKHVEDTVRAGARGLKFELGKPACHWMAMDDPRLDLVYDKAAELGIPIAYHSSDPEEFFYPVNQFNFWLGRNQNGEGEQGYWQRADKVPSREQLARERENMLRKHPKTTFILVHMGWLSRQLALLASILERYPNVYVDFAAALGELGRSPKESAAFLTHYSRRVLFGTDGGIRPMTRDAWEAFQARHFKLLETDGDELEPPYRRAWNVHGLNLPKDALERIYWKNAEELLAGRSR